MFDYLVHQLNKNLTFPFFCITRAQGPRTQTPRAHAQHTHRNKWRTSHSHAHTHTHTHAKSHAHSQSHPHPHSLHVPHSTGLTLAFATLQLLAVPVCSYLVPACNNGQTVLPCRPTRGGFDEGPSQGRPRSGKDCWSSRRLRRSKDTVSKHLFKEHRRGGRTDMGRGSPHLSQRRLISMYQGAEMGTLVAGNGAFIPAIPATVPDVATSHTVCYQMYLPYSNKRTSYF